MTQTPHHTPVFQTPKHWSKSFSSILLVGSVFSLSLLSACAPPKSTSSSSPGATGNENMVSVQEKSLPPFETLEKHGVEYRIARGKPGKAGGTITTSSIGDGPKTFNPWAGFDATSSSMGGMMVSSLLETDAYTGEVIPYLAKSFSLQEDKLTYTVTLRKGLVWSDGKPLTTKDVAFTWDTIIGKGLGNPSTRENLLVDGKFPTIRIIDPLTVEFKTAKPFAPFLRQMGSVPVAPEHVFGPLIQKGGDKAFSASWGSTDATQHPDKFVSSGMWLLDKYELNERVSFKRNPHFFMIDKKEQPLPYLDKVVTIFVKDLNNEQLQFEQGKLDTYSVPAQFVERVNGFKNKKFTLYNLGPTSGTTFLAFNLSPEKNPATGKHKVPPLKLAWFRNTGFRQAIDWAINREDMVSNILKGVGAPLFTAEALNSIFLNKTLAEGHAQDIDKARGVLKQAGFQWDKTGQLLDEKGNKVEFTLYTNTGNDQREATGVNIKQDLAKLGMTVHFKPMEFNVLIDKMSNSGEWESIIMGLTGSNLEPHSGANVWKSSAPLHLFNQRSNTKALNGQPPKDRFPWEAEIDDLFEKGAQEMDLEKRKGIYNQVQEVVARENPFIYLYSPLSIWAAKQRIQNVDPTSISTTHNMEEWWVQDAK
jgi:peptide/nickel transport system substrate-binding protein